MLSKITNMKLFTVLTLLILSTLLLVGCNSTDQSEAIILKVAFQPIVQTDPALISSDAEVFVANAIFDYLIDVDAKSNLIPRLASSWEISEDGLIYTFMLQESVKFHDGSALTSADVVYTFERLSDPDMGFATSSLYSNVLNIEATDDFTVVFTLENTNPFFLYDLSDNHALVIKNGTEDPTDLNGTGPFKLKEYNPEDRIILEKNQEYFLAEEPMLDGVEVIFFPDDVAMVNALRGGQVDLVMRMSVSLFESLKDQDGIQTIDIPTNGFDLIRLRSDREPGNNPLVVQALKLATDREAIFQLVQQGYGAVGNDSPIGPLYETYHDQAITPPSRNIEKAKSLLAEAGYEDGLELTLHVPDSGNRPDLAVVLQQQWAEANINVEVSVEPESVYYGEDGWLEVDLGITGWGSRPYPQFYLDVMLVSDAEWNEAHYANAEFDQLAKTAGTTLDEKARVDAYSQIQSILANDGPIIVPYYFAQLAAINTDFEGFELKAFAGRSDLRSVVMP